MSKKIAALGFSLVFVAFAVPTFASASSLTSAQVSAIIGLLQSFGADANTIANVQVALGVSASLPASGSSSVGLANCVTLYSNTTLGSSGAEVIALQNFLIKAGILPAGDNTGYYGAVTARAVGTLQLNLDILASQNDQGFGNMGPRTRSAIACN